MKRLSALLCVTTLTGCTGPQSAFTPMGQEADRINSLFWLMTISGGLILLLVMAVTGVALFGSKSLRGRLSQERFVVGAGIAFPAIALTLLFVWGLMIMRAGETPAEDGVLKVAISGELWWWRVTYTDTSGNSFESANELHLPVGQKVSLKLTTADVIHSFWAPSLAGKLDMLPGRTNTLTVTATEPGVTRGQCAEYCGGAHALMAFHVVAQTPEEFEAWLAAAAEPARPEGGDGIARGAALFLTAGCGGCHSVRGTEAAGRIGPDLTHVGSRRSIAAGTLPNTAEDFARWIVNNQHIKPENKMPAYEIFTEAELADLAAYLEALK